MTPRVPETPISAFALLAVQTLNLLGVVLMIAAWPVLALADLLRRRRQVIIVVAPEHLPGQPEAYLGELRTAA